MSDQSSHLLLADTGAEVYRLIPFHQPEEVYELLVSMADVSTRSAQRQKASGLACPMIPDNAVSATIQVEL